MSQSNDKDVKERSANVKDTERKPETRPIRTPQDLVDELKRTGQFESLRRAMLRDFLRSRRGEEFLDYIDETIIDELDRLHPSSSSARTPALNKADGIKEILRTIDRSQAYRNADEDFDNITVTAFLRDMEDDLSDALRRNRREMQKKDSDIKKER